MGLSDQMGGSSVFFGTNLQFLRRKNAITQEQLAQQMGVSRQTVSKWESGQAPELSKLLDLSDLFSCPLDDLLRQDLTIQTSPVQILRVKGFSMARYTMISPHALEDLHSYFQSWAARNGLTDPLCLIWSLPYVSAEQKNRLGLTGFGAACIVPDDFSPLHAGPELTSQGDCSYARLTITEPQGRNSTQISRAIQTILEFLRASGIRKTARDGYLPCFEQRYIRDGIHYADIFLQCEGTSPEERFQF